jgi:hypothetical protein
MADATPSSAAYVRRGLQNAAQDQNTATVSDDPTAKYPAHFDEQSDRGMDRDWTRDALDGV